jgi:hypothetical protein
MFFNPFLGSGASWISMLQGFNFNISVHEVDQSKNIDALSLKNPIGTFKDNEDFGQKI